MQPLTPKEDEFATFIHNMGPRADLSAMMDEIAKALGMTHEEVEARLDDLEARGIIEMTIGLAEASPISEDTAVSNYYQWTRKQ
jgi:DNA-binding MarR family transcriptional regulator